MLYNIYIKFLIYIISNILFQNIDSIEVHFNSDISNTILIYLNEKDFGIILMNKMINNICYKLNQLSYEIFYTEYNRFNFNDPLTKNDIVKSFKKLHKLRINFDFHHIKSFLLLTSEYVTCHVDSKKYSYVYDEIFTLLLPYLSKINDLNINDEIFNF